MWKYVLILKYKLFTSNICSCNNAYQPLIHLLSRRPEEDVLLSVVAAGLERDQEGKNLCSARGEASRGGEIGDILGCCTDNEEVTYTHKHTQTTHLLVSADWI